MTNQEEPEYVYSLDEEYFDDFDAIQDQVDSDFEPGEKISGYVGEPVPVTHADIVNQFTYLVDHLQETATEEYGELADDYLIDMTGDIESGLRDTISKYLNENVNEPSWYRVVNIRPFIFTSRLDDE